MNIDTDKPIYSHADMEQRVRQARLERSIAIGRAFIRAVDAVGGALKRAFGSDRAQRDATPSRRAMNREALQRER